MKRFYYWRQKGYRLHHTGVGWWIEGRYGIPPAIGYHDTFEEAFKAFRAAYKEAKHAKKTGERRFDPDWMY